MGGHKLIFMTYIPLLVSLFFLFLVVPIHSLDVCANVDCGRGTCVPDSSSIIQFKCVCDPGWKIAQLGLLTFPSCIVPNCTLDFQCGNGAPPPPPVAPPPFNLFSPCNLLVWCGDGTCVANGSGNYSCKCNDGSSNLFNQTGLACFKQCSFGADCGGLKLGPHSPSPPSPPNGITPPPSLPPPLSPPHGSNNISRSWRIGDGFHMVLLYAIILALVL